MLFKAFGYTPEDLLSYFYESEKILVKSNHYFKAFNEEFLKGHRASQDVMDPNTGEVVVKKGRVFTQRILKRMKADKLDAIPITLEELTDKIIASSILHPVTREIIAKSNEIVSEELLNRLNAAGITEFEVAVYRWNHHRGFHSKDADAGQSPVKKKPFLKSIAG